MIGKGLFSLIPRKNVPQKEEDAVAIPIPSIAESAQKLVSKPTVPKSPRAAIDSVFHIEVEKIKPNPLQPRRDFERSELEELAQSVREFGILQPLIVSKLVKETDTGAEVEYQLIAGERRLMAAKIIGLERVPTIVKDTAERREKLEMALIENIQRRDLGPLEEARGYARLQDEFGLTQREIASRVGKSREVVANAVRLLDLPSHVQNALETGKINESHARILLAMTNADEQNKALTVLLNQKMSVRTLAERVKKPRAVSPDDLYWSKRFEEALGAPVRVLRQGGKGKMVIQFYSEDEWRGIIQKLLGEAVE